MMLMTFRASAVLALSAILLVGCGGSGSDGASAGASKGCTERDGGWFGRSADGALISSQTKEACEERLGG